MTMAYCTAMPARAQEFPKGGGQKFRSLFLLFDF